MRKLSQYLYKLLPCPIFNFLYGKKYLYEFRKKNRVENFKNIIDGNGKFFIKGRDRSKKIIVYRILNDGLGLMSVIKDFLPWFDWAESMGLQPFVIWDRKDSFINVFPLGVQNRIDNVLHQKMSLDNIKDSIGKYDMYIEDLHTGCSRLIKRRGSSSKFVSELFYFDNIMNKPYNRFVKSIYDKYLKYNSELENLIQTYDKKLKEVNYNAMAVMLREEFALSESEMLLNLDDSRKKIMQMHPHVMKIQEMSVDIEKIIKKNNISVLFVTTMVQDSIDYMKDKFGNEKVMYINRIRETYDDMLKRLNEVENVDMIDNEKMDQEYFAECVLASKCRSIMGNTSSGMRMSMVMNGGCYDDVFFMDYNDRLTQRYFHK